MSWKVSGHSALDLSCPGNLSLLKGQTPSYVKLLLASKAVWLLAFESDPLVAIYNAPSKEKATAVKYFCEACAAYMPAREQDWQMHSRGLSHQCQLLSLCGTGELGHVPQGNAEANAGY